MPDSPLPNTILPSGFDAAAAGVLASARSPLERAAESAPAPSQEPFRQDFDPSQPQQRQAPASSEPSPLTAFQSRLEAARGADQSPYQQQRPAQQQAAAPVDAQGQQQQARPALEPRRPNGKKLAAESRFAAEKATREQALARVQELEAQLQDRRHGTAQPQMPVQQAQASEPQDWSKLPIEKLFEHPELKRLKEERDIYYEEVKHTRVEADPEFRAKFDSRRDAAINIAKRSAGGAADDIAKIMQLGDSDARRAALAERLTSGNFSDASKAKIAAAVASLDALDVERELEIASRKATWEHTQASRQQQQAMQRQQREGQLNGEFEAVVNQWADPEKGMPFVLNDPQRVVNEARRLFSAETQPRALAEGAMKAAVMPLIMEQYMGALDEVHKLQEQVKLLGGALPMDNGSSYVPPSTPARQVTSHLDPGYVQNFASALEAARAADAMRNR